MRDRRRRSQRLSSIAGAVMKYRKSAALASAKRNSIAVEQIHEFVAGVVSRHEVSPCTIQRMCGNNAKVDYGVSSKLKKISFGHDMVPGHRRGRELRAAAEEDQQRIVPRPNRFAECGLAHRPPRAARRQQAILGAGHLAEQTKSGRRRGGRFPERSRTARTAARTASADFRVKPAQPRPGIATRDDGMIGCATLHW